MSQKIKKRKKKLKIRRKRSCQGDTTILPFILAPLTTRAGGLRDKDCFPAPPPLSNMHILKKTGTIQRLGLVLLLQYSLEASEPRVLGPRTCLGSWSWAVFLPLTQAGITPGMEMGWRVLLLYGHLGLICQMLGMT